nr:spidroin-1-like [Aegilops tauschii subsp. strangulata]
MGQRTLTGTDASRRWRAVRTPVWAPAQASGGAGSPAAVVSRGSTGRPAGGAGEREAELRWLQREGAAVAAAYSSDSKAAAGGRGGASGRVGGREAAASSGGRRATRAERRRRRAKGVARARARRRRMQGAAATVGSRGVGEIKRAACACQGGRGCHGRWARARRRCGRQSTATGVRRVARTARPRGGSGRSGSC